MSSVIEDMETAATFAAETLREECLEEVSIAALTPALAFAGAGMLLGYSLLTKKRRISIPVQVLLALLAGGAGMIAWRRRQEELEAARYLMERVHDVRDRRWLKRHPVAYG